MGKRGETFVMCLKGILLLRDYGLKWVGKKDGELDGSLIAKSRRRGGKWKGSRILMKSDIDVDRSDRTK